MEQWLFIPFSFGLLSSLHCLGMCGGIVGALSLSLPTEVKDSPLRRWSYLLAYNMGRIASYALAGALAALFGQGIVTGLSPEIGHGLLQFVAAMALILTGFYLGNWLPRLARMEAMGAPLWRLLEPVGRRLLPARNLGHALIFGLIWGWFPCFLVYSALIWSVAAPTPLAGAAAMVAFGLGTLPAVSALGAMWHWIIRLAHRRRLKQVAAWILVCAGVAGLVWNPNHIEHASHLPIAPMATPSGEGSSAPVVEETKNPHHTH